MGRLAAIFAMMATPGLAWDFTPVPICTLSAQTEKGEVQVTYDPRASLYEIRLIYTEELGWSEAPFFEIEFIGTRGNVISTNRHSVTEDGKTLSVNDTGFGNVLDGLEFNSTAQARSGPNTMEMSLAGAAEPVQAFRACGEAALS